MLEPELVQQRVALFRPGGDVSRPAHVAPIVRVLQDSSDDLVIHKASRAAAFLLRCTHARARPLAHLTVLPCSVNPVDEAVALAFLRWIHSQMRSFGTVASASVEPSSFTVAAVTALSVRLLLFRSPAPLPSPRPDCQPKRGSRPHGAAVPHH